MKRGVLKYLDPLINSVASYSLPSFSQSTKNYLKAFCPHLSQLLGFEIGANAEIDLYFPVFNPVTKAPCPPILNPVTDILSLLTGKNVETTLGSSSVIYVNIWKCFLYFSEVELT